MHTMRLFIFCHTVLPTLSRLGYTSQECDAILEEISMSAAKDDADSGGDADGLFARTGPSTLEKVRLSSVFVWMAAM